jgi:Tol biopolymer transport system component
MNEDGSDVKQLTHDPNFPIGDARWSPDGTRIVYTSLDDRVTGPWRERTSGLYVMNADGTGRYKLTTPPIEAFSYPFDTRPVWSPDAKTTAFSRLMPPEISGDLDIFVIDLDGRNERTVARNRNLLEYVGGWFADGSSILTQYFDYSRRDSAGRPDGKGQIARLDLVGNYTQVLSPYQRDDSAPVLSPNDSNVVFSSWMDSTRRSMGLFLMRSDGSSVRPMTMQSHWRESPVDWSSDGQRILYNTEDEQVIPYKDPPREIFIININGSNMRKITPFNYTEAYFRATSWRRR